MKNTESHSTAYAHVTPLISGLVSAMLALSGCAAELDTEPDTIDDAFVEQVAELESNGARFTFTAEYDEDDNEPVIAITELHVDETPSQLRRLAELRATSLESFLAIARPGTEAPDALHDAHPREAARLGRSAEVRQISLADIPKSTYDSSTCNGYSSFVGSVNDLDYPQYDASFDNHTLILANGGIVFAAMCNYTDDRVDYKYAKFCSETLSHPGVYRCQSEVIVPDGHRVDRLWVGATNGRMVRAKTLEHYTLPVRSYIAIGSVPPVP